MAREVGKSIVYANFLRRQTLPSGEGRAILSIPAPSSGAVKTSSQTHTLTYGKHNWPPSNKAGKFLPMFIQPFGAADVPQISSMQGSVV